jgi:dipeptidase E
MAMAAFKKAISALKKEKPASSKLNLLLCSAQWVSTFPEEIKDLYQASPENPKTIMVVPYAGEDLQAYVDKVGKALAPLGINVIGANSVKDPVALLDKVDGVFVPGGNTFRLADKLQKTGLDKAIRRKVRAGMPYMGSSAGTNVACPTMMTTNDMPIIQPESFKAIGIVPFQINAHYFAGAFKYDDDGKGNYIPYAGETRDDRIIQFQEEEKIPVLGLRESTALRVRGDKVELLGSKPVRLFQPGKTPVDITDTKTLSALMVPKEAIKHGRHRKIQGRHRKL